MHTVFSAAQIGPVTASINEKNYSGWTKRACELFMAHLDTAKRPITTEEVYDANPEFAKRTVSRPGWGAIPVRLAAMGFALKVGQRLRDDSGISLKHDLGLWWKPNTPFDSDWVRQVGVLQHIEGTPKKVVLVINHLEIMSPIERAQVFNALSEMEVA